MPSFSQWYSQQHAPWNRTRRLRASPYLARSDTNTSRRATTLATGTANDAPSATNDVEVNFSEPPKERRQETLFGPNIGIVGDGPAWAQSHDAKKSPSSDVLTPEIVRRWVEMSKETVQPTTTLQALVNLKRPTLRLSPLEAQTSDDPSVGAESHDNHALEFEYDCDAPKCSITVQAIVSSSEPNPQGSPSPSSRHITIYQSVFEGGFGRLLKLEDGATVELGRFEHIAARDAQAVDVDHSPKADTNLITTQITELPEGASQPNVTSATTSDQQDNTRKRRFTALNFRRRSQNRSVSGPALAVVDNDAAATTEVGEREKDSPTEDGVRVVIQLMALDDFGKELSSVNRQSTYLHVVRLGSPIIGEEHRSWVVKVVKREATIGSHTFHLHEIYGLSSASNQSTVPAVNLTEHTYPPTATTPAEDEPSSECLVCLSSPREVVLLPCRHLVACKECAINMVEFGAGGAIIHAEEPTIAEPQPAEIAEPPAVSDSGPPAVASGPAEEASPASGAVPENGVGNADSPAVEASQGTAQPAREDDQVPLSTSSSPPGPATQVPSNPPETPSAPPPQNPRRKRRAKGWACPVCRQPYTSLLRITTSPPSDVGKEGKRISTSTVDHPLTTAVQVTPAAITRQTGPTPALESTPEEPVTPVPAPPRSLRPAFFRGLSRRAAEPVSPV